MLGDVFKKQTKKEAHKKPQTNKKVLPPLLQSSQKKLKMGQCRCKTSNALPNVSPSFLCRASCLLSDFFQPQNVVFGRNISRSILSFKQLLFGKQAYVWHHQGFLKEEKATLFSKCSKTVFSAESDVKWFLEA